MQRRPLKTYLALAAAVFSLAQLPCVQAKPSLAPAPQYIISGHFYTTQKVAEEGGLTQEIADRLAVFSQVPDEYVLRYSAPAVAVWGVVDWKYRHVVMNTLHSLHNGKEQQVLMRRAALAEMLSTYDPGNIKTQWQMGFLIHALADSYAHVKVVKGHLHAFNELYGHAFATGHKDPDKLNATTVATYIKYNNALFCALTRPENRSEAQKTSFQEWTITLKQKNGQVFDESRSKLSTKFRPIADAEFASKTTAEVRAFLFSWTTELERRLAAVDPKTFKANAHEDCLLPV